MKKLNFFAGMVSLAGFVWATSWSFEYSTLEYLLYLFILWYNLVVGIVNISIGLEDKDE